MKYFVIITLLVFTCSKPLDSEIWLKQLDSNRENYNEALINRTDGFHSVNGFEVKDSTLAIITVHGYYPDGWSTKGFEWVDPLKALSNNKASILFYKYNWKSCADAIADSLKHHIEKLIQKEIGLDSLWIIGHSFGGVVSSLFSEKWKSDFPITVHSIAAPLQNQGRSKDKCANKGRDQYKIEQYVNYTQWKTIQSQDGAFKHLDYDPQAVKINNGKTIILPKEWNHSRLGHNGSILFVANQITN